MTYENALLGEVAVFFNNQRKPITKAARVPGEYRYYGAAGIQDYVEGYLFDGEFILVGEDGTVVTESGNPVIQRAAGKFWVNNHAHVIRPKNEDDFDFLFYAVANANIEDLISGAVQPKLSMTNLKQLQIPWPQDSGIRSAIGLALRALDRKSENNNEIAATLEVLAQTVFKSWFIDFDPVKAKMAGEAPVGMDAETAALFPNSMEESELGEIPSGWALGPISQVLTLQGGYSFKSKDWKNSGVPVVKIGSVKPGFVDATQTSFVSPELAATVPSKFLLPRGSLVIGLTGYVGEVGLVERVPETPLLNQRVARFGLVNSPWRIPFAYCITRSEKFKKDVIASATGSAQANVSTPDILALKRVIPTGDLIERFDALFEPLFEQMLLLREQAASLRELRDSLLPRLVSGELEIPEEMLAA